MTKVIIDIQHLSKSYTQRKYDKINSLHSFSLPIHQGEKWGIIGKNGSGKSTLLSILAGIVKPTSGEIKIYGSLSYILDVGSNFIPELTGKENVSMFLSLHGCSNAKINLLFDKVAAFADIGAFINQPVKTYSNGMFLRLAFAASIQIESDILLIDEVFNAGDAAFREKLKQHFNNQFDSSAQTVLLASHNPDEIMEFCTHCLWLDKGHVIQTGRAKDVVSAYYRSIHQESINHKHQENIKDKNVFQTKIENEFENEILKLLQFKVDRVEEAKVISYDTGMTFFVSVFKKSDSVSIHPQIVIYDYQQKPVLTLFPQIGSAVDLACFDLRRYTGPLTFSVTLPPMLITYGYFFAELRFGRNLDLNNDFNEEAGRIQEKLFFVIEKSTLNEYIGRTENVFVRPKSDWQMNRTMPNT